MGRQGSPRGEASDADRLVIATPIREATARGYTNGEAASECLIPFDLAQLTHPANRSRCDPGSPSPALTGANRNHVAKTLTSRQTRNDGGTQEFVTAGVRRLTPLECERLQGFPDGWTCLCPAKGDTATCRCKDGPRYKALGNAVPVPVVEWIARRMR
jgi:DNA (cytosine-5)-methyltransferase 1